MAQAVGAHRRAGWRSASAASACAATALAAWSWRVFLALVFLLLFGPIVILVAFAFNDSTILAFPIEGLTTKWFGEVFDDTLLRKALDELDRDRVDRGADVRGPGDARRVRADAVPVPGPRASSGRSWARRSSSRGSSSASRR